MSGKATLSLVLVAAGSALAAGGPAVFAAVAAFGWQHLHILLFAVAGAMVLAAVIPGRALTVPLVIVALGLAVLMVRSDGLSSTGRFAVAVVLTGFGLLLAVGLDRQLDVTLDRRRWVVLFPRPMRVKELPGRVRLVAVNGTLTADLSQAGPQDDVVELFLSNWYGQINLQLPTEWAVVAGRVIGSRPDRLTGELTTTDRFEDPNGKDRERIEKLLENEESTTAVVVIHVLGVGGGVTFTRRG